VTQNGQFNHNIVKVNNQRLHYVEQGSGPLVILVHGFPESWYSWRKQLAALAQAGYRAVAPDMRGYGRSSKPKHIHDYKVTELVADLEGLVRELGENSAIIGGHDWGAMVAWTAAWTRPDVFRAVAAMGVPFGGRGLIPVTGVSTYGELSPSQTGRAIAGSEDKLFYQEYWQQPGALDVEFEDDPRGFLTSLYFSFSADAVPEGVELPDPRTATIEQVTAAINSPGITMSAGDKFRDGLAYPENVPNWLQEDIDFYVAEFERTGLEAPLHWYRSMDLDWELLAPYEGKPVTVPAVFIAGALDPSTLWGAESIQRFDEMVPEMTEVILLRDCGHWVTREQPDQVSEALVNFVDSV